MLTLFRWTPQLPTHQGTRAGVQMPRAVKFGAGVNYQIPRSRVRLYVEAATWAYKWNQYGFDKTQFDLSWSGGLAYTF